MPQLTLYNYWRSSSSHRVRIALALKGLERYAESVSRLEVLCNLDSGGLTVSIRVDGKAEGAWAGLVHEQRPGPSWGSSAIAGTAP